MTETAIFRIHTKDISRSRIDAAYFLMSPERRERCDRYLREDDKVLCILSDMLLREKLSEKLGADMLGQLGICVAGKDYDFLAM